MDDGGTNSGARFTIGPPYSNNIYNTYFPKKSFIEFNPRGLLHSVSFEHLNKFNVWVLSSFIVVVTSLILIIISF